MPADLVNKTRVLVLGYGLIGAQRTHALSKLSQVSEITVIDPGKDRPASLPQKTQWSDFETALSQKWDATIIATPHDAAVQIFPKVASISKRILIEKPLGRTAQEGSDLIKTAESLGCELSVGLNYRFLKNVQRLKELIDQGKLGHLLNIQTHLAHGAAPGYEKSWKTSREKCGGGVCIDPGIHVLDLISWLTGSFGKLELQSGLLSKTFWPIEVEDHASLLLSLDSKIPVQVSLSISSWQSRFEMIFEFERAQIFLNGRGKFYGPQTLTVVSRWPWLNPDQPRESREDYGSEDPSLEKETEAFILGKPIAAAKEALESMKIVDQCYQKLKILDGGMSR